MKSFLIIIILLSVNFLANDRYIIYEKLDAQSDSVTFVKVNGIDEDIELLIGAGTPKVLSLDATQNTYIKLLKCFGGYIGTSSMVGYFYTYILDFKNNKILGVIEFSEEEIDGDDEIKKPTWIFLKDTVEVKYQDWYSDGDKKSLIFKLPTS